MTSYRRNKAILNPNLNFDNTVPIAKRNLIFYDSKSNYKTFKNFALSILAGWGFSLDTVLETKHKNFKKCIKLNFPQNQGV